MWRGNYWPLELICAHSRRLRDFPSTRRFRWFCRGGCFSPPGVRPFRLGNLAISSILRNTKITFVRVSASVTIPPFHYSRRDRNAGGLKHPPLLDYLGGFDCV